MARLPSREERQLGLGWIGTELGAAIQVTDPLTGPLRRWFRRRGSAIQQFVLGIWPYLVLYVVLYIVMATLFFVAEGAGSGPYTWGQSLYFAVGAFAGVTFSDVYPTNGYARIIAAVMILMFVFLLALVITGFGRRAEKVGRDDALGMLGTTMSSHFVVIGSDAVAQVATRDLLRQGLNVALVMERPEDVDRLRPLASPERLFLTYGPPAEEETLRRVNVDQSRGVIVSLEDDAQTLVVALLVQGRAPSARLIVSANRPELRSTMRRAGITFVASPLEMGGRICASAAFEPDVALAVDELTTVSVGSVFGEYVLDASGPLVGRSFKEAVVDVLSRTDAILIGYSRADSGGVRRLVLSPKSDEVLQPGDAVIVVVRADRQAGLKALLGVQNGH